jgi:hypothetical protein
MGLSSRPEGGYDKKTQGNMVGYAFAAQYPARVTRFVIMDAPLRDVGTWDEIACCLLLATDSPGEMTQRAAGFSSKASSAAASAAREMLSCAARLHQHAQRPGQTPTCYPSFRAELASPGVAGAALATLATETRRSQERKGRLTALLHERAICSYHSESKPQERGRP